MLTDVLEPTNEPYAIAKIAGIKMCESYNRQYGRDYRSVMPTNLYGPGDNYDPETSHVIAALINRFHEAKLRNATIVKIWGTGKPRREFLHVYDMAEASIFVHNLSKEKYNSITEPMSSHINIGIGKDISIEELAEHICKITSYTGNIIYDSKKPDGMPRKLLNVEKLESLGWKARINLKDGLKMTYEQFKKDYEKIQ